MSRSKHGKIDGQFVPLLYATLDSPAWIAASHGARSLYVALKRRHPRERNTAYISFRTAQKELTASPSKIKEWFAELEHYGFIVLHQPGSLGVDGKGKAPHWRLTELGKTPRTSAEGLPEPPSRDYLRWDGVLFDPTSFRVKRGSTPWEANKLKKQNPASHVGNTPFPTGETPPLPTGETPKTESVSHGVHIESDEGVSHGVHISSVTTSGSASAAASSPSQPSPDASSGEKNHVGPPREGSNVVHIDPRLETLKATEARRRKEGAGQ